LELADEPKAEEERQERREGLTIFKERELVLSNDVYSFAFAALLDPA